MESPRHLIGQEAAQHGVSANQAKRALYLKGLSADDRSVSDAATALRVRPETIKTIARRYMIDFVDYRPYASLERKGLPRPEPKTRDIHQPASALPMFAAGAPVLRGQRMGDFYEFFGADAEAAAKVLDIALTTRGGQPMCGIPVHASERYRSTLIESGFAVELLGKDGLPVAA